MSELHALLIGVDFYTGVWLPGDIRYTSLGGCVRDILHVEAYLREGLRVPEERITKLLASNNGGTTPVEAPDQQPTYANIILAMRALRDRVKEGDQVYIHYSGHGGRTRTFFPQMKGPSGYDEALVPTDIGAPNSRYLRDLEIAYLMHELLEKKVYLTVIFDSCHSGGATRGVDGKKAVSRGPNGKDESDYEIESLVASTDELIASWSRQPRPAASRSANERTASGWLLEPAGYTFLAACRASETALEYPFNGSESNGALTYWLLDTLRNAKNGWSYKMLHDRILAKVHGQFASQTPQLQGEGQREIFASGFMRAFYSIPVMEVSGTQVRVQAGEVQGVRADDTLAIYPHDVTDEQFGLPEYQIATATIANVESASSWAKATPKAPSTTIESPAVEVGDRAELLQSTRLVRTVGLFEINDAAAEARLKAAIEKDGAGFVTLVGGDEMGFQVTVNEKNEWEICDPAGVPLPHIRPALDAKDASTPAQVVKRLIHLCKYFNILALTAPDGEERKKLAVELVVDGSPVAEDETTKLTFHPGDKLRMNLSNLHDAGSGRILNVALLLLHSDWSVTQIFPGASQDTHQLDPGTAPVPLDFEAYLPEGHKHSRDVFKLFATEEPTAFRFLELPSLDKPDLPRSAKRGNLNDPLVQMFAAITDKKAATRSWTLTNSGAAKNWAVTQIELTVEKRGGG